jgi:hypothetical protein
MSVADEAVNQLSNLLVEYESQVRDDGSGFGPYIGEHVTVRGTALTKLSSAIDRFAPRGSSYHEEAKRIQASNYSADKRAYSLLGVVRGLRDDYQAGHMRTVEELVHADLFADFLDIAKELLDKGYKDPAAVVAGSVLEEHLRKLAYKSDIPVLDQNGRPRRAEALNTDLAKVYGEGERKSVTAWLDKRNDAAHPTTTDTSPSQVALMIDSVRDFTLRHTA